MPGLGGRQGTRVDDRDGMALNKFTLSNNHIICLSYVHFYELRTITEFEFVSEDLTYSDVLRGKTNLLRELFILQ